jgi:hypothetical protein
LRRSERLAARQQQANINPNADPDQAPGIQSPEQLSAEDAPPEEPPVDDHPVIPPNQPMAEFALTPAAAHRNILDYSTTEHAKLFRAAIAPLEGDKYDGTPEKLKGFLDRLQQKAEDYTWKDTVLTIPIGEGDNPPTRNLVDDYGNITLEQVQEHARTYIAVAGGSREWQNSHQLKTCIFDSLTQEFQNRVNLDKDKWHINGHPDGACMLKVIISLAYIDTQATSAFIRTELTRMDEKIRSFQYDVKKFNTWVKGQVSALAARGETTSDLIVNLFKGYEAVPDKVFKDYIEQKKSTFEEGGTINPDEMMQLAQNKYEGRVLAQTWNALSDEQEQIIALEAQIKSLQSRNQDRNKQKANKQTNSKRGVSKSPTANRNNKNKSGKDQSTRNNDYMNALGKWSWLKVAPKTGETKKIYEGKTFFWCKNHQRWGRHTPNSCRKGKDKPEGAAKGKPTNEATRTLQLAENLEAIIEADNDDDDI